MNFFILQRMHYLILDSSNLCQTVAFISYMMQILSINAYLLP